MHVEGFEGAQMPLQRRLPKFGFNSPNRITYQIVNVGSLDQLAAGAVVDESLLRERGMVKGSGSGIKILGNGTLSKKLTAKAHKFSPGARPAIQKAGRAGDELSLV